MKTAPLFAMLVSVLLLNGCSTFPEKNSSPDELGQLLFETLKHGEKKTFDAYISTPDDLDDFANRSTDSLAEREKQKIELREQWQSSQDRLLTLFDHLREEGKIAGILNWSETEFITVTQDKNRNKTHPRRRLFILFSYKGLRYSLTVYQCILTQRGWVMASYWGRLWAADLKGPLRE